MAPLSLVLPFLDEQSLIPRALTDLERALRRARHPWEVILVDSGSADGSRACAEAFANRLGWSLVSPEIRPPSVGRAVAAGVAAARGSLILVLPADVGLTEAHLDRLVDSGARCGGFEKRYAPDTPALAAYARLQNALRLRRGRHVVWTNGIFFHRDCLPERGVPTVGFLEDVILSDHLRTRDGWAALSPPLSVSSRRYYPDRVWRRMGLNGIILALFRGRLAGPERLRRFYRSLA